MLGAVFETHGPGGPSKGRQAKHALYPEAIAESLSGNVVRFSGFVRRPGGQLGLQKILVVVQALNIDAI